MNQQRESQAEMTAMQAAMRAWREEWFSQVINVVFWAAIPMFIFGSYYVYISHTVLYIPVFVGAFIVLGVLKFGTKLPYQLRAGTFAMLIYGLALSFLLRAGLHGVGKLFLAAFVFLMTIFLGRGVGIVSLALSMVTMAVFGWLFTTGYLTIAPAIMQSNTSISAWVNFSIDLFIVAFFLMTTQHYLLPRLVASLVRSQQLAEEIESERKQADAAAQATTQWATQVRDAAALGRKLVGFRERATLTQHLVDEMEQTFDLYQASLFLVDERSRRLRLVAASGERGASWVMGGWEISMGGSSLPGQVAQSGKEQMMRLTEGEISRLPGSQFEVSLPLMMRGELLGVLDLHRAVAPFMPEETEVFRIVADYAAAALDNLRVLAETDAQLQEMRALYTQYTAASWATLMEIEQVDTHAIAEGEYVEELARVLAEEAMAKRSPQSMPLEDGEHYLLVVPLIAREYPLGYVAFVRSAEKGEADLLPVIEMAANRLALALDNTRLLMETRRRAMYEQQLGRIGDVVWSSPTPEMIMERSVQELGRLLGASSVTLQLAPSSSQASQSYQAPQADTKDEK